MSCYIHDCIFIEESGKELTDNVRYAVQLSDFVRLGIDSSKSVLVPMQVVDFLRITLNF